MKAKKFRREDRNKKNMKQENDDLWKKYEEVQQELIELRFIATNVVLAWMKKENVVSEMNDLKKILGVYDL